jgi:hypothetical protein
MSQKGGERAYRVASGRTGVQAKAVIPWREKSITARSRHRPKPPRTWVADRTFDLGRNERHSNGSSSQSALFLTAIHRREKVMNSERQASRFSIVIPEI